MSLDVNWRSWCNGHANFTSFLPQFFMDESFKLQGINAPVPGAKLGYAGQIDPSWL